MTKKKVIIFSCPDCKSNQVIHWKSNDSNIVCRSCLNTWLWKENDDFRDCPLCSCSAFFIQKSIHPFVMWGGLVVAIIFVPFTYGLSLPFLWLIDCALQKFIPYLVVCYACRASFLGFNIPKRLKLFQHHIGERHDPLK